MNFKSILISVLSLMVAIPLMADDTPTISPTATFVNTDGESEEGTSFSGSAPLEAHFYANPSDVGSWNATYEWRFYTEEDQETPYLIRYEENTDYTFTTAGTHRIACFAVFTQGNDTISYTDEYWSEAGYFTVSISESKLDMPNAFSPNGDGINDIYKAKDGWQSIVEFKATIFNRWGQKLFEWTDPNDGWDGTFNGKDVKQGVYFCLVKAKGADGREFHIRKDVNLLRGYTESSTSSDY